MNKKLQEIPLHLMLLPGVILTIIFSYVPIAGIVIAFQKFVPSKGIFHSKWIGLDNFRYMLEMPNFSSVVWNTVFIAVMKIIVHLIVPVIFALLLNEVISTAFKRTIQTIIYFPYFLSWVILGGILIDILSPSGGIVNQMLGLLGIKPIFSLATKTGFLLHLSLQTLGRNSDIARSFI